MSGAVLRELREEYLDTPAEDSQSLGEKQASTGLENKRKLEYEENYMTRLPVTKQERHRRRQVTTLGSLGDEITSFGGSSSGAGKKRKAPKGKAKKSTKDLGLKFLWGPFKDSKSQFLINYPHFYQISQLLDPAGSKNSTKRIKDGRNLFDSVFS